MDTARFLRLREIFDCAIHLPAAERKAYLDRECGGDAELRAEAQALWEAYLAPSASAAPEGSPTEPSVGPYRIRARIGEGGMGSVYLAIRDDGAFRKQVALKILRPDQVSADLIKRFHQERQVLANLDHPNIARILDGGQTPEGLPYYVMDYVEGMPLDRFCDERKLDLAGRVGLFQQLCYAVHYLHDNLVIHRDLKPSNILVTEDATVKLLDFGIAKLQIPAASERTAPHNRLMTPTYASPEQFSGAPVTRASDIYSLGVILYQLLTGTQPFADPAAKLHVDPPPPSRGIREDINRTPETTAQLRRRIVGDLDHIVLMCLRRDPQQRYGSAGELAEDLQRFLEGRTVLARPGHLTERMVKFVKRNRVAVASAMLVMLLALFGAWQALEAQMQTRRVQAKDNEIARLLDTLGKSSSKPAALVNGVRQFRQALERELPLPSAADPTATGERRALFRRALQYLDGIAPYALQDPALGAELAQSYQSLGVLVEPLYPDIALGAFQKAAATLAALAPGDPEQGPYRAQWLFLTPRIRNLGGSAPAYAAAPATRSQEPSKTPTGGYGNPLPRPVRATAAEVTSDATPLVAQPAAAVDPAARRAVESRLMDVTAKAQTADEVMNQLRATSAALGQIVHPDIANAYNRMKLALGAATRDFDSGLLGDTRENLDIADAWANRVLKAGGQ
jgi:serine/threonine protein kinase